MLVTDHAAHALRQAPVSLSFDVGQNKMHPITIAFIAISTVIGFVLLCLYRGWKQRESEINSEFESRMKFYSEQFGHTETGQRFLGDIGSASKVRLSDPASVALSAAASTGIWTKVLGGSTGSSLATGLFVAAVGFVAEAFSKVGMNKNKTESQIAEESRIALLLKAYAEGKQGATTGMALITVFWMLIIAVYVGWKTIK